MNGKNRPQIESIQILRCVAASLVVMSHLFFMDQKHSGMDAALPGFMRNGAAGVDLFFVISGFVMVVIASRETPGRFVYSRITRIYPTWWFYLSLTAITALIVPSAVASNTEHSALWRSYLLLPDHGRPLLVVGWTLIHEMYFYLVFALILLFRGNLLRWLLYWGAIVILVAGSEAVTAIHLPDSPFLTLIFSPLTLEFILGGLVGLLFLSTRRSGFWSLLLGTLAFVIGLSQTGYAGAPAWTRVLVFGPPAAAIVYGAAAVGRPTRSWLGHTLSRLGDASYSTYLVHLLVLSAFWRLIPSWKGWTDSVLLFISGLILANLAGLLSYLYLERPIIKLSRRLWDAYAKGAPFPAKLEQARPDQPA